MRPLLLQRRGQPQRLLSMCSLNFSGSGPAHLMPARASRLQPTRLVGLTWSIAPGLYEGLQIVVR